MTKNAFSDSKIRRVLRRELVEAAIDVHESLKFSPETVARGIANGSLPSEGHPVAKRVDRYAARGIDVRCGDSGNEWSKSVIQNELESINDGNELSPTHEERVGAYTEQLHEAVGHLVAEFGWGQSEGDEPEFMRTVRELFDYFAENA